MSNLIASDSKVVGENSIGVGQNHILTMASGRIYAGHLQDTTNYLVIHYSDNSGTSWTQDFTFGEIVDCNCFSMCKSELDDLFVCFWTGTGTTTRTVYVKKRTSAGVWSQVLSQAITMQATETMGAMICYNRLINRLHLVFCLHNNSGYIGTFGMYSSDRGATWTSFATLTTPVSGGGTVMSHLWGVDTDPLTGKVYIGIGCYNGSLADADAVIQCNSDHSSVSTPVSLTLIDSSSYKGGALVVDSSGNYYTAYFCTTSGPVYRLRVYRNASVSYDINLGSDTLFDGDISLACDVQDNIYLLYNKVADSKAYYVQYVKSTATWGTETALTSGDGLRVVVEQHPKPSSSQLNYIFYTTS